MGPSPRATSTGGVGSMHGGVYPAPRAAALTGVPLSTLHYWSRREIVVPSISAVREKLWSFADLMCLRVVVWLRREEKTFHGHPVPKTTMREVRAAITALEREGLGLWEGDQQVSPVTVDARGHVQMWIRQQLHDVRMQPAFSNEYLSVLSAFSLDARIVGPDLLRPRPHLRIVPGKLSGEPHVEGSRLATIGIAALARDGCTIDDLAQLYPHYERRVFVEAIDLEAQLARNLHPTVAA